MLEYVAVVRDPAWGETKSCPNTLTVLVEVNGRYGTRHFEFEKRKKLEYPDGQIERAVGGAGQWGQPNFKGWVGQVVHLEADEGFYVSSFADVTKILNLVFQRTGKAAIADYLLGLPELVGQVYPLNDGRPEFPERVAEPVLERLRSRLPKLDTDDEPDSELFETFEPMPGAMFRFLRNKQTGEIGRIVSSLRDLAGKTDQRKHLRKVIEHYSELAKQPTWYVDHRATYFAEHLEARSGIDAPNSFPPQVLPWKPMKGDGFIGMTDFKRIASQCGRRLGDREVRDAPILQMVKYSEAGEPSRRRVHFGQAIAHFGIDLKAIDAEKVNPADPFTTGYATGEYPSDSA